MLASVLHHLVLLYCEPWAVVYSFGVVVLSHLPKLVLWGFFYSRCFCFAAWFCCALTLVVCSIVGRFFCETFGYVLVCFAVLCYVFCLTLRLLLCGPVFRSRLFVKTFLLYVWVCFAVLCFAVLWPSVLYGPIPHGDRDRRLLFASFFAVFGLCSLVTWWLLSTMAQCLFGSAVVVRCDLEPVSG